MEQNHTRAGQALEQARREAGLSQAEMARRLDMSRSTYLRRLSGEKPFNSDELVLILSEFKLALAPLLGAA